MKLKLYAIAYGALALSIGEINTNSAMTTKANFTPSITRSFEVSMVLCVFLVCDNIIVCLTTSSRNGIIDAKSFNGSKSLTLTTIAIVAT